MVLFALSTDWVAIIAAFTSLLGCAMAIISHISTRRDASLKAFNECHEKLLEEQRTSERLSKQLHDLRMKHGEADE